VAYERRKPSASDSRKQSIYMPDEMVEQVRGEAKRQDRSVSRIIQLAWTEARDRIARYPSMPGPKQQQ
jgi:uncharacterized small protein (TIGR04563 family)